MIQARKRLGEILVEAGAIDETQLRAALGHQRQWGGKLGRTLVDLKLVAEPVVVSALSRRLDCEVAQLDALQRGPELDEALRLVPGELARRHLAMPIAAAKGTLTVAMADPANVAAVDDISFKSGRRVKAVLAGEREIARAVHKYYGAEQRADAIAVDFDLHAEDGDVDPAVFDSSPAKFQERFYRSSLRDWSDGAAQPSAAPAPASAAIANAIASAPAPSGATPPSTQPGAPAAEPRNGLTEALLRMAAGAEVPQLPSPTLVAAVSMALIRRGLVTEAEIVAELLRARRPGAPRRT